MSGSILTRMVTLGRMIAEEVLDCGNFVSGPPYKCEKRDEI